ncbi:MAG TPA: tetratricopeptide repeat protein [Prolixibacteraceae bacterium]|nr:tetratricopeptide repeat protein [Prolixibacteraceae bacterium]
MFKQIIATAILIVSFMLNLIAQNKIETAFFKGNYEKALHLIELREQDETLKENEHLLAAQCHAALFDYPKAIERYKAATQANLQNMNAWEGLADASINLGYKENALNAYNQILQTDSLNIRILGKKATLLSDMNRYAEAETIYRSLLDKNNHNPFFYRRLMIAMHKQRNYLEIIKTYEAEPNFIDNDKEIQMVVADAFFRVGGNIETLAIIDQILQNDSLYTPALSRAGHIHFTIYHNYYTAVKLYRTLNRINGFSDPFHLKNLAICEYFTGNQHFAAQVLDSLITELADDPMVPFYAGLSYRKLGNIDRALELLEYAVGMLSMPPFTSDFYHHLGRAYSAKRMYPEALEAYQTVLEYDAENVQVLYDIAITHEEYNRNQTVALTYYQQFLQASQGKSTPDVSYAENRVKRIKEELFFE